MSQHSYSRCWLHLVWATHNRDKLLRREARIQLSDHLIEYAKSKNIYMRSNYVNADHVHALIDLPTNLSIEDALHLLKGSSSHWVNQNGLTDSRFAWQRGYGAFSVSESVVPKTLAYIANQEDHHRSRSFTEEYRGFMEFHGLEYRDEQNR
jgi:putative transposase